MYNMIFCQTYITAEKSVRPKVLRAKPKQAGREARVSAPKSIAFPPQNQWTALCVANEKVGQFSESQILMPSAGIEPTSTP